MAVSLKDLLPPYFAYYDKDFIEKTHIAPATRSRIDLALEAYEGGKTLNDQIYAMKQGSICSSGGALTT